MDFREIVKNCMQDQNINSSNLAKITGYSLQYILDLLSGKRRWNETTINKVCEALDIKIKYSYKSMG